MVERPDGRTRKTRCQGQHPPGTRGLGHIGGLGHDREDTLVGTGEHAGDRLTREGPEEGRRVAARPGQRDRLVGPLDANARPPGRPPLPSGLAQ